jgi:hypothetical protein
MGLELRRGMLGGLLLFHNKNLAVRDRNEHGALALLLKESRRDQAVKCFSLRRLVGTEGATFCSEKVLARGHSDVDSFIRARNAENPFPRKAASGNLAVQCDYFIYRHGRAPDFGNPFPSDALPVRLGKLRKENRYK